MSLKTRLASMLYETVLLAALLFVATALFVAAFGDSRLPPSRTILQVYLFAVAGVYFVWNWTGGRRTLAMHTWRMRVVDRQGLPPSVRLASIRYLAAAAGLAACAISIVWTLVDPERQFLHDRIAGTRLARDSTGPPADDR